MTDSPSLYLAQRRKMEMTRAQLRRERWLRWHVFLIAACTLAFLMSGGALLRWVGIEALAWRYALLLPLTYLIYLALLRLWAAYLLSRDDGSLDLADALTDLPLPRSGRGGANHPFEAGGGGDFGGGGASGDFGDLAGDAAGELAKGAAKVGGEALGALDEGVIVVVPLAALVAIIALLAGVLSAGILMVFGVEVLLAVAVEVALAAWAGGLAYKHRYQRDGWLGRALAHTWRGALMMLVLGIALGAAIDHWLPGADSLPEALTMLRGKR